MQARIDKKISSQETKWQTIMRKIRRFIRGFTRITDSLYYYKISFIEEDIDENYFWFQINIDWLLMNYEPEEMSIYGFQINVISED